MVKQCICAYITTSFRESVYGPLLGVMGKHSGGNMAILIKGGTVVTAEGESRQDVLIVGETIAAVGNDIDAPGWVSHH